MNVLAVYDIHGNIDGLRGNGERETAEAAAAPTAPADGDLPRVTAAVTAGKLGGDRAQRLSDLPLVLILDGVLYCHATPRADDDMVTRASTPERFATVLAGVDAPAVVVAPTHQQDDRIVGDVLFVNAGSVGLPYERDGAARGLLAGDQQPAREH